MSIAASYADSEDITIWLTEGYSLRLFPAASRGEHWRVFQNNDTSRYVVCES